MKSGGNLVIIELEKGEYYFQFLITNRNLEYFFKNTKFGHKHEHHHHEEDKRVDKVMLSADRISEMIKNSGLQPLETKRVYF